MSQSNAVMSIVSDAEDKAEENAIVARAIEIIEGRMRDAGAVLSSPREVRSYLRLNIGNLDHEVFCVLFLDCRNRLIECVEMFRGTLTETGIYPREVVKEALARNAAGVIVAHNHPSGKPEPSPADIALTRRLKETLSLIDVRVLDHFITTEKDVYSLAEHGQI